MTAQTTAGRPRLRELRVEVGWTQQQLAEKLAHLAWTHGQGHAAVNADMVAKWKHGTKGISPRYRALLCELFGATAEQLGFAPAASDSPGRSVRDAESLVSMLNDAASLLDQLGVVGTALAPQMLSAWAGIQACIYADSGDHPAAADALQRAEPVTAHRAVQPPLLTDHGPAHVATTTGHVHLQAGNHTVARATLAAALDQLPRTARRARILALTAPIRHGPPPDYPLQRAISN